MVNDPDRNTTLHNKPTWSKDVFMTKIKTLMNRERQKSVDHFSFILKTFEESRVSNGVFSKNHKQLDLPIFYDVDPSDVRCGSSYQMAFAKLQQQRGRFPSNLEKIQKWKSALSSIAPSTGSYEEWQLQKWAMAKHENMFGRDSRKVQKWRPVLRQVASLHEIDSDKDEHVRIMSSIVKRVTTGVSLSQNGDHIQSFAEENQQKPRWRYDVFISFKGNDTRERYTGYLYHALHYKGFKAFADEEAKLEKDGNINLMTTLGNAIEESRILIVVLSENYVLSTDCLRVLTMILDSKKKNNQLVIPIFYGVHPSDVRKHSYGDAMNALKEDYGKEEVEKWSLALKEVADLRNDDHDHKIGEDKRDDHITNIVKEVTDALPCYDVFLSLNGKDNLSFTDFLRKAFDAKGFKIFPKDKGSEDGDQTSISINNVTAIGKSRLSIIIFSENYVHSPSCLDELVAIMSCMEKDRQLVWPIFYKVEPSDIRHQTNSFGKALIEHESKSGHDKVKVWKSAMSQAANLKGWHLKIGDEYEIIEEIVKKAIEI